MRIVPEIEIHCSCGHCEMHRDALDIVVLPDEDYDRLKSAYDSGEMPEQELVQEVEELIREGESGE